MVLGVSPDSVESHQKFKRKFDLPYSLLADTEHGVWQLKSMFAVKYWGNARTTFLIAPDGTVARVFDKVKAAEHGEELAAALAEEAGRPA